MSEFDFDLTTYVDDTQYVHTSEPARRIPLSIVFIFAFIVLTMIVGKIPGAGWVITVCGAVCAFVYAIAAVRSGWFVPPEVLIFWLFTAWSVTGLFVALSTGMVMGKLITMLQFCVMMLIVGHYARGICATRILLWGLFLGCLVVAASAYTTGDYLREADVSEWRVTGLAQGPNYFSLLLLTVSVVMLYFFRTWKSWVFKVLAIAFLLVFARLIVASGSRKGVLCFVLLMFCWFLFSYMREIRTRPKTVLAGMVLALVVTGVFWWMVQNSRTSERLSDIYWGGGLGDTAVGRFEAYKVGLEFLLQNPVFGIGQNNFRVLTQGSILYSHSNYVEVFASTGFFGGILFFSSYVVLWRRLRRLSRYVLMPSERELVNMGCVFLIMQVVTDLFSASYYDKRVWIMLPILIGWSCRKEKEIRTRSSTWQFRNQRLAA